jgi:hypothetical protein
MLRKHTPVLKEKSTWVDVREAKGTVAINSCVELNGTVMLKVFTYDGAES